MSVRGRGAALLVLGLVLGACTTGVGGVRAGHDPGAPSTARREEPPTAPSEPETPPPTPAAAIFAPIEVSGGGDDVVDLRIPGDEAAILEIAYSGGSNFAVWSYSTGGEQLDLLVNTIGSYQGVRLVNVFVGEEVAELEVTASAPWTVTARPVTDAPLVVGEYSGTGDAVVRYGAGETRARLTHAGDSNFAVWAYGEDVDLLVNTIGPYEGTVRVPAGTAVLDITADGPWTILPG